MYPDISSFQVIPRVGLALIAIHSHNDGNFITSYSNNLVDGPNTSSGQLG
jgi:hypothetical protein